MNIKDNARHMKLASPVLAASSNEQRNLALKMAADRLLAHKDEIFAANAEDVAAALEDHVSPAIIKRLKFTEEKLADSLAGISQLMELPDPLNKTLLARELDEGLTLRRVSCPIGVIGVIFEARPDALIQISCLCIKSGNCAILKGGRETARTNKVLFELILAAVIEAGLPAETLLQAQTHNEIDELLSCDKDIDLIIPRGSNAFVQYIMNHTKIPVMGHADGICHIYMDKDADLEKAIPIIVDAKTQYTAACNAVETLLVDRPAAGEMLPAAAKALTEAGVSLFGTQEVCELLSWHDIPCTPIADDDFHREYLALSISIKLVDGVAEAVDHINRYGSHHTDSILTEDAEAAEYFMQMVDSAGVYQNCSTRFADGFRYGFGAEVGISTSKLHARGPVGLEGLVTYKYKLTGSGQIVGDYASGKKSFHHKDLAE